LTNNYISVIYVSNKKNMQKELKTMLIAIGLIILAIVNKELRESSLRQDNQQKANLQEFIIDSLKNYSNGY
jgi:transposase